MGSTGASRARQKTNEADGDIGASCCGFLSDGSSLATDVYGRQTLANAVALDHAPRRNASTQRELRMHQSEAYHLLPTLAARLSLSPDPPPTSAMCSAGNASTSLTTAFGTLNGGERGSTTICGRRAGGRSQAELEARRRRQRGAPARRRAFGRSS